MNFIGVLLLLACCVSVSLACNKKCKGKKDEHGMSQPCCGSPTRIKLDIKIIGGGCKCSKKHKKKRQSGATGDGNSGSSGNGGGTVANISSSEEKTSLQP